MAENEQDLRDEQDRVGYADVRPKEKQYREPNNKVSSTLIIQEPNPRHPTRQLLPQQTSTENINTAIDNITKKKNQERQNQLNKQQHSSRYQPDPINENHHQSYPQPQPNLSSSSVGYAPNVSQAYPSTSALKSSSTGYVSMYAPPSSLAPPVAGSVQPSQVPYPPQQQPGYSDERRSDPKQYNASDLGMILERLSRMESKLDKISDLEAEIKELKREKEMMKPKMQASRSDLDYPQTHNMHRRASIGRFPQDRYIYNKSADHHSGGSNGSGGSNRYFQNEYVDDAHYPPPPLHYYPYEYFNSKNITPPKEEMKSTRSRRRHRSQSFGNNQEHELDYHQYYNSNKHGYF